MSEIYVFNYMCKLILSMQISVKESAYT